MNYYINLQDRVIGPMPIIDIVQLYKEGLILDTTQIRSEDHQTNWQYIINELPFIRKLDKLKGSEISKSVVTDANIPFGTVFWMVVKVHLAVLILTPILFIGLLIFMTVLSIFAI